MPKGVFLKAFVNDSILVLWNWSIELFFLGFEVHAIMSTFLTKKGQQKIMRGSSLSSAPAAMPYQENQKKLSNTLNICSHYTLPKNQPCLPSLSSSTSSTSAVVPHFSRTLLKKFLVGFPYFCLSVWGLFSSMGKQCTAQNLDEINT